MKLREKAIHFYIKNIKREIDCPNCYSKKIGSQMRVDRKRKIWLCDKCNYSISCKDFENDYIFWFCDNCETFLNVQNGFVIKEKRWICTECGFNNDVSSSNIVNECIGCNKLMDPNDNHLYCEVCRTKRLEKITKILRFTSEVCLALSECFKQVDDNSIPLYSSNVSAVEYLESLDGVYEKGSLKTRNKINEVVKKTTGHTYSEFNERQVEIMSYTRKWFKKATDQELSVEREKVRQAYCKSGRDHNLAVKLQNLLYEFDGEISRRAWDGETEYAYPRHREHGWYLPNDGDD